MAIADCGTFWYVSEVPPRDRWHEWVLEDASGAASLPEDADPIVRRRLVGLRPGLSIEGCRLTLEARDVHRAQIRSASFELDDEVIAALQPGDYLTLMRTGSGDLAVSAVRTRVLLFAAGALPVVPLGHGIRATALFPPHVDSCRSLEVDVRLSTRDDVRILKKGEDVAIGVWRACLLQRPDTMCPITYGVGVIGRETIPLDALKRAADRMYLEMREFERPALPRLTRLWTRLRGACGT